MFFTTFGEGINLRIPIYLFCQSFQHRKIKKLLAVCVDARVLHRKDTEFTNDALAIDMGVNSCHSAVSKKYCII